MNWFVIIICALSIAVTFYSIGYEYCKNKVLKASRTHGRVWFYSDGYKTEFLISPVIPTHVSDNWMEQHKLSVKNHNYRYNL